MHDIVDDHGQNALQLYAQSCKQADLALTGTVRKANLIASAAKMTPAVTQAMRRASTANLPQNGTALDKEREGNPVQHPGYKLCVTCGVDTSPRWWPIDSTDEETLFKHPVGSEAQKYLEQRLFRCHKCRSRSKKLNLCPVPAPLEPAASLISGLVAPQLRSPPLPLSDSARSSMSYPWVTSASAATVAAHTSPTGPPPMTPTASTAPSVQAPLPPSSHLNTGTASVAYGAAGARFAEWQGRPPTQHGSPSRQVNGAPPPIPTASLGNLSTLRPPPMSMPPGPPGPNGMHGPPMLNGLPPSPRRIEGHPLPLSHASPYAHPYHHQPPPPPHSMTNGGPPPPPSARGADSFAQGLLSRGPPFSSPHGTSQGHRDSPLSAPDMRHADPPTPRAAGASTSPSLRNLLS